jgi:hypothetical protein
MKVMDIVQDENDDLPPNLRNARVVISPRAVIFKGTKKNPPTMEIIIDITLPPAQEAVDFWAKHVDKLMKMLLVVLKEAVDRVSTGNDLHQKGIY